MVKESCKISNQLWLGIAIGMLIVLVGAGSLIIIVVHEARQGTNNYNNYRCGTSEYCGCAINSNYARSISAGPGIMYSGCAMRNDKQVANPLTNNNIYTGKG